MDSNATVKRLATATRIMKRMSLLIIRWSFIITFQCNCPCLLFTIWEEKKIASIQWNYNQKKVSTIQQQTLNNSTFNQIKSIEMVTATLTGTSWLLPSYAISPRVKQLRRITMHLRNKAVVADSWRKSGNKLELSPRVTVGGSFRKWMADWVGGTAERFQYLSLISLWSA